MFEWKDNLSLVVTALVAAGCGSKQDAPPPYGVPDVLRSPATVYGVPAGSHDVAAAPPAGAAQGTVVVTLLGEAGATIYYSLQAFDASTPEGSLTQYKTPLALLAPVTVWAEADVGGTRGPVRSFAYTEDAAWLAPIVPLVQQRLPPAGQTVVPLTASAGLVDFAADGASARLAATPPVDGSGTDFPSTLAGSRTITYAPLGTMPPSMQATELASVQAGETDDAIYVVLATRQPPVNAAGRVYGFDIGPSNVSFATFGSGSNLLYHVEASNGGLTLTQESGSAPLPLSKASQFAVGAVVEIKLAKSDLPQLGDATDVIIRGFAADVTTGTLVTGRTEPLFLRSSFALARSQIKVDTRTFDVDILSDPTFTDAQVAQPYADLAAVVIPELEQLNVQRFRQTGTIPLFYVDKDEDGYTGLNTTDRGVLTTIGPGTSEIAKAQLLSHEFAHFQNARFSQLKPRWLQEGMSEWTAERFLYRHFPRRAVYKFEKNLRFDRYFDTLNGGLDDFPLGNWGTEPSVLGYEKCLMFMDLLEARVGQDVLIKAFQQAVNDGLDTAGFEAFLEKETGEDLSALFAYWAVSGTPAPDADPYKLFKATAGDDLYGLDKELLGDDPTLADTDDDGWLDGEEYFRGKDPLARVLTSADYGDGTGTVAPALADPDTSSLARLAGAKGATHVWSLNWFSTAPEQAYLDPLLLRTPYTIAAQSTLAGKTGTVQTFSRGLWLAGKAVTTDLATVGILPPAPLSTETLSIDQTLLTAGTGPGQASAAPLVAPSAVLPAFLSPYALTAGTVTQSGSSGPVAVTLSTAGTPAPYGDYGDYTVSFNSIDWTQSGGTPTQHYAVALSGGSPYLHTIDNGVDSAAQMNSGIIWSIGDQVAMTVDASQLPSWTGATGDQLVCLSTAMTLEGGTSLADNLGCVTLAAPGFTRQAASVPDRYGLGTHTLEVFLSSSTNTAARLSNLIQLGTTALDEFEHSLGMPLWERHWWPVHVEYLTGAGAQTAGTAATRTGAFLAVPDNLPQSQVDYLFVEQLARLAMADLAERNGGSPPFWVQELFVQWLTSSALYRFYPSKEVHAFHAGRIADFTCYLQGGCSTLFASDGPLANWGPSSLSSTGSVRSLILTLELDAMAGSAAMGQALATYANGMPSEANLAGILGGLVPAKAADIKSLLSLFVDGSGDAAADQTQILQPLQVGGDGLYLFEEQKLGAAASTYLN